MSTRVCILAFMPCHKEPARAGLEVEKIDRLILRAIKLFQCVVHRKYVAKKMMCSISCEVFPPDIIFISNRTLAFSPTALSGHGGW
jgi:hypothetical protein